MTVPYDLPPPINLGTAYRGDSIRLPTWVATERGVPVEEGGVIVNLTGATIWFTAKRNLQDADGAAPGFQVSTVIGGVSIVDAATGTYRVEIPPTATVALDQPQVFQWDVQVRTTEPRTLTVARGTLSIALDATQTVA